MTFTKDMWLSILRSALTFIGTLIIGHTVIGHTIDTPTWEVVGGILLTGTGTIWGIFDKTTGLEQWASFARSLIIGLGGIGVSWGLLSANTFAAIGAFVTAILPVILNQTQKVTNKKIADGTVAVQSSTGKVLKTIPPKY